MHRQDPDFSYVNEDGKRVVGAAATSHEIYTMHGGVAGYNNYIGEKYIRIHQEAFRGFAKGHGNGMPS